MFLKKRMQTTLVLMLFLPTITFCQFNIKIGYIGGFTKAPDMNGIISKFNDEFVSKYNGKLDDNLNEIKFLNGLEVGTRYRLNNVGFELTWNSMITKSDAFGALASGNRVQSKWYTSFTQYALGIENYIGNFGYGAAFGYRTARIKTAIEGTQRKKAEVVSQSGWTSRFYLLYQIPSNIVALAIKPYVEIPLKNLDITNFDQELFYKIDKSYVSPKPINERFMMYGISIVLYNGPQ
jgi:hypothetical protein